MARSVITDTAIETVKENNRRFYLKALDFAHEFVKITMKPFSSEDLKDAFHKLNEPAREPRVWGAVIRELNKSGAISFHDYRHYEASQGHSRPSTVWISREYSLKQSANASMKGRSRADTGQITLI